MIPATTATAITVKPTPRPILVAVVIPWLEETGAAAPEVAAGAGVPVGEELFVALVVADEVDDLQALLAVTQSWMGTAGPTEVLEVEVSLAAVLGCEVVVDKLEVEELDAGAGVVDEGGGVLAGGVDVGDAVAGARVAADTSC